MIFFGFNLRKSRVIRTKNYKPLEVYSKFRVLTSLTSNCDFQERNS